MSKRTDALAVIIPTHGRPTLLGRTLDSLAECEMPEGYVETVVVENGPKAGADEVVLEAAAEHTHLRLRYMHVERANKSHALNEALKSVVDGLVVFFDDDVRLDKRVIRAYARAASLNPAGTFFGGPVACDYEEAPPAWMQAYLPYSVRGFSVEDAKRWGHFLGANWAAYTRDLRAIGGFDANYGPGSTSGARGQEKNAQLRLLTAGIAALPVSGALVWHYVPHERCSPEWVIQRTVQTGVLQGKEAAMRRDRATALRACRDLIRGNLSMIKRLLLGDAAGKYSARIAIGKNKGFLKGYLMSNRQSQCN